MPNDHDLFLNVDSKHRLFRKITRCFLRNRLLALAGKHGAEAPIEDDRIVEVAFELRTNPEILLDSTGVVLAVNLHAREMFGLAGDSVGRPFQQLEISDRPVELRSNVDQARAEGRVVHLDGTSSWTPNGDLTFLDITLVPLLIEDQHVGVVITFVDVTRHRQFQLELEEARRELEIAYEELQSANKELETTNEELQSMIQDFETTNKELQSTNEELETMNEELSSTNEELQATNDEMRDRTDDVNQVKAYMESVLATLEASAIVVDSGQQVRVWNGRSFEMCGLRAEEVEGRNVLSLDLGFPVDTLAPAIRACLQGDDTGEPVVVQALTRRGHMVACVGRVAPLRGAAGRIEGAIILVNEQGSSS